MVNSKNILQIFSYIFFVLIILDVSMYEEAFSFQAVSPSGNPAVWQLGNRAVRQLGSRATGQSGHLASIALAATEGSDHHGVPKVVFYQVLNFLLFAGLLFYLLKDKVKSFYQNRFDLFQKQFEAAYKEREEMEASYKDYQQKLEQINLTSEDQIAKAKQEAGATKSRMLNEVDLESKRIQQEAQTLLGLEHKREKRLIQAEFVEKVIDRIQSEISGNVTDEDKKAFIQRFEVSLK